MQWNFFFYLIDLLFITSENIYSCDSENYFRLTRSIFLCLLPWKELNNIHKTNDCVLKWRLFYCLSRVIGPKAVWNNRLITFSCKYLIIVRRLTFFVNTCSAKNLSFRLIKSTSLCLNICKFYDIIENFENKISRAFILSYILNCIELTIHTMKIFVFA